MILVDTSVWIDHLRTGDERLIDLLDSSQVLAHPFVIGELACRNLRKRDDVLRLLNDLPQAPVASYEEVLHLIESYKLMGQGGRLYRYPSSGFCRIGGYSLALDTRPALAEDRQKAEAGF